MLGPLYQIILKRSSIDDELCDSEHCIDTCRTLYSLCSCQSLTCTLLQRPTEVVTVTNQTTLTAVDCNENCDFPHFLLYNLIFSKTNHDQYLINSTAEKCRNHADFDHNLFNHPKCISESNDYVTLKWLPNFATLLDNEKLEIHCTCGSRGSRSPRGQFVPNHGWYRRFLYYTLFSILRQDVHMFIDKCRNTRTKGVCVEYIQYIMQNL